MKSPSQLIIQKWLQVMTEEKISTTALASLTQLAKKDIKRILSGQAPLTLDHLMLLSQHIPVPEKEWMELMTLLAEEKNHQQETPVAKAKITKAPLLSDSESDEESWIPDPMKCHAEQLLKMGFALGINIYFMVNTSEIQNSGIPQSALQNYPKTMPIHLDPNYFQYYQPQYFREGLQIRLAFEEIHTCLIPWHAIFQITFHVEEEPYEPESLDEDSEEPSTHPSAPFLRVVK